MKIDFLIETGSQKSKAIKEVAKKYGLKLPVCVSTALARGITDAQNAQRHGLLGDNLHPDFELVGLADLAMQLDDDTQLQQF